MLNGLTNRTFKSALMAGAAVAVAGGFAPAYAQDKAVEKVTVTGTRIPQKGLTSVSPVTTIDSKESLRQGTTSAEQLLNNMPQVLANQTPEQSNAATGTATLDLRGLGPQRTLVLINGRRMHSASNASPYPDINNIPIALVERVELLTGGASAVYGADAVAGVVNFILRKDFEGVLMTAQYGITDHDNDDAYLRRVIQGFNNNNPAEFKNADEHVNDGRTISLAGIMGANSADGKGNVTLYAQYRHAEAIFQADRDFSACSLGSTGNPADPYTCNGSPSAAPGRFFTPSGQFKGTPSGSFAPFNTVTDAFNFGPYNYLQRPNDRYLLGAMGRYELASDLEVYAELSLADDRTVAQIAPSGIFRTGNAAAPDFLWRVNCNNPFLLSGVAPNRPFDRICDGLTTTDTATLDMARRFVESGGRQDDLRHTSYRGVLGLTGEFADIGWDYEIFGQYATTVYTDTYLNDVSITRINRALAVVDPDGAGPLGPTCQSVLDGSDAGCVPANIFVPGQLDPLSISYMAVPGLQKGRSEQTIVSASTNGDIGVTSPWADTPVAVAFGGEYRAEELELVVDLAFQTGDLSGQGGATPPAVGHYDVWEAFGEIQLPLIEDAPFAKLLEVNAGYRISDYDLSGITHTYKWGGSWVPVEDIRLRGAFQRAVRAPNIVELFTPQTRGLIGGNDPCASTTAGPATYSPAQCANTFQGFTAGQIAVLVPLIRAPGGASQCPADQCGSLDGGNPNLKPEVADTITLGAIFTPTFLKGFNLTVDYYDIFVEELIDPIPSGTIIAKCAETGDPTMCSLIKRSPGGLLFGAGFVVQTEVNTGSLQTTGVDLEMNYKFDMADLGLDIGSMAVNLVGTKIMTYDQEPIKGEAIIECAGFYARECGLPQPEWRHKLRATWTTGFDWEFSLQWRYIDSVDLLPPADAVQGTIPSFDYFDLSFGWTMTDNIDIRGGVSNLLDEDPPLIHGGVDQFGGGPFNANTYPTVYDSLGRELFIGMTTRF